MSNKFINKYVAEKLQEQLKAEVFAPQSCYSADNAVGAAYYALQKFRETKTEDYVRNKACQLELSGFINILAV
jgi:hypothetical protein